MGLRVTVRTQKSGRVHVKSDNGLRQFLPLPHTPSERPIKALKSASWTLVEYSLIS